MSRIIKAFYTLLVIWLVVLGLNLSNQGINQVSGESRGPVLNVVWYNHSLHWDWLGKGHEYSTVWLENKIRLWFSFLQKPFI